MQGAVFVLLFQMYGSVFPIHWISAGDKCLKFIVRFTNGGSPKVWDRGCWRGRPSFLQSQADAPDTLPTQNPAACWRAI